MKSVCFSAFILHISGTDRCKIGVRYLIFRPVKKITKMFIERKVTKENNKVTVTLIYT
jgi:hypothetical protein